MKGAIHSQAERASVIDNGYSAVVGHYEVHCVQVRFMHKYFRQIATMYRQRTGESTQKSIAAYVDCMSLGNRSIMAQFIGAAGFLEESVLDDLEAMSVTMNEVIVTSKGKVEKSQRELKGIQEAGICATKEVERIGEEVTAMHAKIATADEKVKEKFRQRIKDFYGCIHTLKIAVDTMNKAYGRHCEVVNMEIADLTEREGQSVTQLFCVLKRFIGEFRNRAVKVYDSCQALKRYEFDWRTDFVKFAELCQLSRKNLPVHVLEPFQFSFTDDVLKTAPNYSNIATDAPILVATINKNLPKKPGFLELKTNSTVFLYAQPVMKTCYALSTDGQRGYVPSDAIKLTSKKMAFVGKAHIPVDGDGISVACGDVVIVGARVKQGFTCTTIFGDTGILPDDVILSDS